MANLNSGQSVDLAKILDYKQAIIDFAEGNKDLQELLTNCFQRGIKTKACCQGHQEKGQVAYITFEFNEFNEKYIYAIMAKLQERNIVISYHKNMKTSIISFEEDPKFDFKNEPLLFSEINEAITKYDENEKYYENLPEDLQNYLQIIQFAETDEEMTAIDSNNYFQFSYCKCNQIYEYSFWTTYITYNLLADLYGFKYENPFLYLDVINRLKASKRLAEILRMLKYYAQEVKNLNLNYNAENQIYELVITNENLYLVARKLIYCKNMGMKVFTNFNGLELNNYNCNSVGEIMNLYSSQINSLSNR